MNINQNDITNLSKNKFSLYDSTKFKDYERDKDTKQIIDDQD